MLDQGVILYADDHVFDSSRSEGRLFDLLRKEFPVLPVDNLLYASVAIKSIGSFSAIILDWEFQIIDEELPNPIIQNPEALLDNNEFYSLIYVYSRKDIPVAIKTRYKKKFKDRIKFKRKIHPDSQATRNLNRIKKDLKKWTNTNKKLEVALKWSNSINESVQSIFDELSQLDINWIFDLHKTAMKDGVNPEIEVVNLLQNVLAEKVITNKELLDKINNLVNNERRSPQEDKEKAIARLFQRIYYTDLNSYSIDEVPIMTGDVFLLNRSQGTYGILITPECDIGKVISDESNHFELLTFSKKDFENYVTKTYKDNDATRRLSKNSKGKVEKLFNQNDGRYHILPSFKFTKTSIDIAAILDFSKPPVHVTHKKLKVRIRNCKLNTPFIQQLRQRYLAYNGRVGVPAITQTIKQKNIKPLL